VKAIVIGAGIGGLTTALGLVRHGYDVVILERAASTGGKMREALLGEVAIDAGPTVLTMRWVFDELFATLGERLDDWVSLRAAEVLARHAFEDGSTLDLFADLERSAAAVAAFAGPRESDAYRRFCAHTERIYAEVEGPFLRAGRPTLRTIATEHGLDGLTRMARIDAHRSMWGAIRSFFRDPRLIALFARYATYTGSSPLAAPATLNLIAHVERSGVSHVEGGMARLAEAMTRLFLARGGEVRCGAEVASIEHARGAVTGVRLASGEHVSAAIVVANCDAAALARGDLGEAAGRGMTSPGERERSLSAITWVMSATTRGFPLLRHNVFFSADYRAEVVDLFERARTPEAPTVYVCAQDRADAPIEGQAPERLLVLTNAPARDRRWTPEEIDRCETRTFERLSRAGLTLVETARVRATPEDFDRLYPATRGALYGRAADGMLSPLRRPGARTALRGLYLAGGSAHPGAGVPMVALSGRIAAASAIADHPLTGSSPRAAMPGGTPTS